MAAFLGFLAKIGRLSGDDPETLTAAVARLRVRFERYARDPRNWGPAKAMVMQMRAEGIDPFEPGALEAAPRASTLARAATEMTTASVARLPQPRSPEGTATDGKGGVQAQPALVGKPVLDPKPRHAEEVADVAAHH